MAETRYSILETQGQMCVSVSGYIIVFHLSVAAFTMEPEHFFTCFQQISISGITVSLIINVCLYCENEKFRTRNLLFRSFFCWWI